MEIRHIVTMQPHGREEEFSERTSKPKMLEKSKVLNKACLGKSFFKSKGKVMAF